VGAVFTFMNGVQGLQRYLGRNLPAFGVTVFSLEH
jgi:hypothetical protein